MSAKKIKVSNSLPNKDEQLQLRETQSLMSSNMLHLQLDEMLEAVRYQNVGEKKKKTLQVWLMSLLAELNSAGSDFEGSVITESWLANQDIDMKLENHGGIQSSLIYKKPNAATVIGSYNLKTLIQPNCCIDVAVTLPTVCFEKRDILNYVYFDKRKLYIGVLLHFLKVNSKRIGIENVEVEKWKDDNRKPVLIIRPTAIPTITVRLHPTIECDCFAAKQLRLEKNNVRPAWWMAKLQEIRNDHSSSTEANLDASSLKPTPHYNMAIMEDMAILSQHEMLSSVLSSHPLLREVIMTAKVWLSKRGHRHGLDSLDGYLSTILIIKLFQEGFITAKMSVLAAFMSYLSYLSTIKPATGDYVGTFARFSIWLGMELHDREGCIASSSNGSGYNTFWRVSVSSLDQIRHYASSSLAILQSSASFESTGVGSSFSKVFLMSSNFLVEYDFLLHIPVVNPPEILETSESSLSQSHIDALHDLTGWQYITSAARQVLLRALGNRVTCIDSSPNMICSAYATFGIRFEVLNCRRRVDRGPPAEDEDGCKKYREFWGNITCLRRFRDGSIVESIVWGDESAAASSYPDEVTFEIVSHILQKHLPTHMSKGILAPSLAFGEVLPRSSKDPHIGRDSSSTGLHRNLVEALDSLRQKLTSDLKDFPLTIEGVRGMHPSLRYTSYFPPMKHPIVEMNKEALNAYAGKNVSRMVESFSIVVFFGLSSKWPTNITAIQCVKSALIMRLARCLDVQFEIHCVIHESYLDVFYAGYIFRMHLFVANELALLENGKNHPSNMTVSFCRSLQWAPLHNTAIHAMCGKHESFADTVRLFSCWIDCNMLSGYVNHDTLELLVSFMFMSSSNELNSIKSAGSIAPVSFLFAFFRTLLSISEFDWAESAMIVDFGSYLRSGNDSQRTSDLLDRVNVSFRNLKQQLGGTSMIVSAVYNEVNGFDEDYCTRTVDSSVVSVLLQRVRVTLQVFLTRHVDFALSTQPFATFVAPNKRLEFNVLLTFQKALTLGKSFGDAKYNAIVEGPEHCRVKIYTNLPPQYSDGSNLISRCESFPHPLQMEVVKKLRSRFDDIALFFYNHLCGDEIGVIWKPSAFTPRPFSLLYTRNYCVCTGSDEGGTAVVNPGSVVAEMIALSDGLLSGARFC